MSRRRVYRDETMAVMERFFKALEAIIDVKAIRGVQTYCNDFGIDKRHLYAQKKDLNKGFFEVYCRTSLPVSFVWHFLWR